MDNANPTIKIKSNSTNFQSNSKNQKIIKFDEISLKDSIESGSINTSILSSKSKEKVNQEELQPIDSNEIFDLIRSITDPEHPLTLEDLSVVSSEQIEVTYPEDEDDNPHVMVRFTPTIPHCSMATLIGLTLRVRLLRALPDRFKVDIKIKEGTHQSENSVNKQLNDKERVAAALENAHLLNVVQQCLSTAHLRGQKT
ncbi:uncharacterized protein MELLADRAFT_38203 [Melampsora larici-populina 98AG31]|uniref:MIP18 family-like domain-containing protein n=1 Tax=Melampsora larici-populina (strain 98AG31 / pathotype 3-4-7) TaxID=747676 RepID=F4RWQ5_MELLP|nr:uncharacterized protein MELLADRAFT_38203 [Melampsora larici-populina 98AG31]EGG03071.1 hypothetical protein MELLADRAFT_38203 [Melampsora larici-populina 98AG31]